MIQTQHNTSDRKVSAPALHVVPDEARGERRPLLRSPLMSQIDPYAWVRDEASSLPTRKRETIRRNYQAGEPIKLLAIACNVPTDLVRAVLGDE